MAGPTLWTTRACPFLGNEAQREMRVGNGVGAMGDMGFEL